MTDRPTDAVSRAMRFYVALGLDVRYFAALWHTFNVGHMLATDLDRICRQYCLSLRPMFSDVVNLRGIAKEMINTFDLMIARQDAFRDKHGETSILDIRYKDQVRDPLGEMRRAYAHFGEPFAPETETAMLKHLANHPQGKHGLHRYSLEEFGLTATAVRRHFRDYCDRFDL
jgi:Sulfotransferase family